MVFMLPATSGLLRVGLAAMVIPAEVNAGAGPSAGSIRSESPPPATGLKIARVLRPVLATSAAVSVTRSDVALLNAVGRSAPFQRATDCAKKLEPFTTNVIGALPETRKDGASEEIGGPSEAPASGMPNSHILRPPAAARSVLEGWCRFRPCTSTRGNPDDIVDHVRPPSLV